MSNIIPPKYSNIHTRPLPRTDILHLPDLRYYVVYVTTTGKIFFFESLMMAADGSICNVQHKSGFQKIPGAVSIC